MSLHFAHGRNVLNNENWSITSSSGGNLDAQILYFSLQAANEVGKNLILKSSAINVNQNDKLTFTINPSAKLDSEGWTHYIIGVSTTNDETTFKQIAKLDCYALDSFNNIDYSTPTGFPLTLEITEQSQLITGQYLNNLPEADLVNGMLRGLLEDNSIYEYDLRSDSWNKVNTFNTYISDVTQSGGCAINLYNIGNFSRLSIPKYIPDGTNSAKVQYYLTNDSGFEIPAGTSIKILVDIDGYDKARLFDGKIFYTIKGFVTSENSLRTTYVDSGNALEFIDYVQIYTANIPSLELKDKVRVGESVYIELYINIHEQEFVEQLAQGHVTIIPQFIRSTPRYNPAGFINETIGAINNTYDVLRVKPHFGLLAIIGSGEGTVRNYSFYQPESTLTGFIANTANQKIYINRAGISFIDTQERADTVLRAVVDTTEKESHIGTWLSENVLLENDALRITVTYPCDEERKGKVRSDYPDSLKNEVVYFNVKKINFYVKRNSNGEIRKFTNFLVAASQPQDFTITNWSDGVVVEENALPTTKRSFFNPNTLAAISVTSFGDFPADTYSITHSYVWDGDRISDISHSTENGCIPEIGANLISIDKSVTIVDNVKKIEKGMDLGEWSPESFDGYIATPDTIEKPKEDTVVVPPVEEDPIELPPPPVEEDPIELSVLTPISNQREIVEGEDVTFAFALSRKHDQNVTINYNIACSAPNSNVYIPTDGIVVIPANTTTSNIKIQTIDNDQWTKTKTINVIVTSAVTVDGSVPFNNEFSRPVLIKTNNPIPPLSIKTPSIYIIGKPLGGDLIHNHGESTYIGVLVSGDFPTSRSYTIDYVLEGSAISNKHYVVFEQGNRLQQKPYGTIVDTGFASTLKIATQNLDGDNFGDRTLRFRVVAATVDGEPIEFSDIPTEYVTLRFPGATVVDENNVVVENIAVQDITLSVNTITEKSPTPITVTVTLDQNVTEEAKVYLTLTGNAKEGVDYQTITGANIERNASIVLLTIPANSNTASFNMTMKPDAPFIDGNKTFTIESTLLRTQDINFNYPKKEASLTITKTSNTLKLKNTTAYTNDDNILRTAPAYCTFELERPSNGITTIQWEVQGYTNSYNLPYPHPHPNSFYTGVSYINNGETSTVLTLTSTKTVFLFHKTEITTTSVTNPNENIKLHSSRYYWAKRGPIYQI